jgi:cytosine/adenosine deaminase-related metal-dependent hydrolase
MRLPAVIACLLIAAVVHAQTPAASPVAPFISVNAPVFVLDHVRVIDGTGAPAREDQAVVVANGKIQFVGAAGSAAIPEGAQRMELAGYTVIPGIVGMHNHLFYSDSIAVQVAGGALEQPGLILAEIPYTAPRLYLAAGVTTGLALAGPAA